MEENKFHITDATSYGGGPKGAMVGMAKMIQKIAKPTGQEKLDKINALLEQANEMVIEERREVSEREKVFSEERKEVSDRKRVLDSIQLAMEALKKGDGDAQTP